MDYEQDSQAVDEQDFQAPQSRGGFRGKRRAGLLPVGSARSESAPTSGVPAKVLPNVPLFSAQAPQAQAGTILIDSDDAETVVPETRLPKTLTHWESVHVASR